MNLRAHLIPRMMSSRHYVGWGDMAADSLEIGFPLFLHIDCKDCLFGQACKGGFFININTL